MNFTSHFQTEKAFKDFEARTEFEQEALPEKIYENKVIFKKAIIENPERIFEFISDTVWEGCLKNAVATYLYNLQKNKTLTGNDLTDSVIKFKDECSLNYYQNYNVDVIKLTETQYLILLNMADIYDDLKVDEPDKMVISTYIGIVYNSTSNVFGYYLLERSSDGTYALCSIDAEGNHSTIGNINNDKKEFVESVKSAFEYTEDMEYQLTEAEKLNLKKWIKFIQIPFLKSVSVNTTTIRLVMRMSLQDCILI